MTTRLWPPRADGLPVAREMTLQQYTNPETGETLWSLSAVVAGALRPVEFALDKDGLRALENLAFDALEKDGR